MDVVFDVIPKDVATLKTDRDPTPAAREDVAPASPVAARTPLPSAYFYAVAGVVLAAGAPLGWLGLRWAGGDLGAGLEDELRRNAALYLYQLCGTALMFAAFGFVTGVITDRLRVADAAHQALALTDALTRIGNTRAFHEQLATERSRAIREGRALSLIVLDLDHFKRLNDRFGHAAGDKVLIHVGAVLREGVRAVDVPCRIGGEEFAVLCPGAGPEEAAQIAERLRERLARAPVDLFGTLAEVTASFGVGAFSPLEEATALFQKADRALYASKREGRNRVTVGDPAQGG